jgi:hypothetical protein
MEMKSHEKSLGHNPLSDASYRNPGMVLNGQGPGRHPLGDAPHRRPSVVKNEQRVFAFDSTDAKGKEASRV